MLLPRDIKAYLITAEAGYTFKGQWYRRLSLGVDFASGDDDTLTVNDTVVDKDIQTFSNLYYTGHKFRGLMDYFLGSNPSTTGQREGLVDIYGTFLIVPTEGWRIRTDVHYFKTHKDYRYTFVATGDEVISSDVGTEIDVTIITTRFPGVTLMGGGSVFIVKDNYALLLDRDEIDRPTNSNPGYWGYLMVIANF